MDARDIIRATESTKRLVQDENYYKFIFKKTEKIVSVVFYVSNSLEKDSKTEAVIEDILSAARVSHDRMLRTLEVRAHVAEDSLREAAHSLIALDSKLRVSLSVGAISPEVLNVLTTEIDGVLRGLNKYLVRTTAFDDFDYKVAAPVERTPSERRPVSAAPKTTATPSNAGNESEGDSRRERIRVVLQAKGEATIKDISDIITDVSSKTIQRELNAMITDSVVKRQGERRWSKYSLV